MTDKRVAIVGCGQLAQMMAQEGRALGISFAFLAGEDEDSRCVEGLGDLVRMRAGDKPAALYRALGNPDVITAEREQVPVGLLRDLEQFCPVYPRPDAFEKTQHRLREKQALTDSGLPVAPFLSARGYGEVCRAVSKLRYPAFIKSCENGYDGQNQWRVDNPEMLADIAYEMDSQTYVVEQLVPFTCEVSLIGVRRPRGEVQFYPLTENRHVDGILRVSRAPVLEAGLESRARDYLQKVMEDWDYVGVLAMECFVTESGLVVNELAPRVHNSGHWTLAGAPCSQFANHLRAILDLPLGETRGARSAVMVNMLGVDRAPAAPNEGVWLYGKTLRPGRKMGHVLLVDDDPQRLSARTDAVMAELYPDREEQQVNQ